MSALFAFEVYCLAASADIDFDALIGTHATVTLTTRAGERPFDGIVTEAKWLGAGENGQRYRLILRPWFFLASLRRNQRIFHNKTAVQILEELLGAYADAGALKPQLTADYPVLEYTVQFRESDLDFACRLMEHHGISYHFQHHAGQHDMVLTDMAASHTSIGARPFHPDEGHHQEEIEHFWQWRPARRITTGAIRLTDYNFKTPNAAMEVDRHGDAGYAQGKIESFDWPGGYLDQGRGRTVAALRSDGERGQDRRFEALGDVADLGAGLRVTLSGDNVPGLGDDYLCLAASHSYTSDNYGSGGPQGDELAYRGVYVLMPASAPMLPELKTARADVKGPQTAVVVGEGEIDCDEYGRILVKFHWDLNAAHSMRCRVSQNWAGNGWGGMVIPRIGMEVVVEFLDGDPDQPLVTGCVYNAANMPPYALPANKTKSVFRSDTHQGTGYNELAFEDAQGQENISIHAQRDMTLKVLNTRSTRIDANEIESIGANHSVDIGGNRQEKIGGSMNVSVGSSSGGALFAALAGLIGQAGSKAAEGAGLVGNPIVSQMVSGMSEAGVANEAASLGASGAFSAVGGFRAMAGAGQMAAGAAVGQLLSSVMPISGMVNSVIEKAKSETVGLALTQQVGLFHNTMVGMVQTTYVGQKKIVDVGEELVIQVGLSKLVMKKDGTIRLIGKDLNIAMSGPVQINGETIDLN